MPIKETIARLRELEATIGKHERREDEHCRQIEELERKNALLLDVAKVGTKYFKPNQEFRFLDFENALKAAKDGGAMEEDK